MKLSNHCNFLIALLPIIGTLCHGQTITTYDTRFGIEPVASSYLAVDVGVTDVIRNPDFNIVYRSFPAPSLIDTEYKIGVTITGTVAQAEEDLAALKAEQYPATVKLKDKDRRAEARAARTNAAAANSVPALRDKVARLAELVESLLEDQERRP